MAFDAQDIVDGFDEPKLPAGLAVPDAAVILLTFPPVVAGGVGATYGASVLQLRALLAFSAAVKATPAMPTFADVVNSAAGGSLRIVPATGILMSDNRYKIGLYGSYAVAPLDGVVSVGTANTAVYAYSVETATNNQSGTARSVDFIPVLALPAGGVPSFVNFNDLANVVTLLPAPGQLAADYFYKIGSFGTYAAAPADGVITVGNVAGQVFAYLPASATHAQSTTVASPSFTISLTQLPSVRFDAPLAGATLNYGTPALLSVIATDAAGIASVEFFNGSTSIGTGTSNGSEYVVYWTPTTGTSANLTAKATNTVGVVGTATNYVLLQTAPAVPNPPTGVYGVAGNAQVTLGWTAPNTNGVPIIKYYVFANNSPVPLSPSSNQPYFTDLYAKNGIPIVYTVQTVTSGGVSANSQASVSVTPMAPTVVTTVPGAPTVAAVPGSTSIGVYLTPSTNTGGATINYYDIYRNNAKIGTTASTYYSDSLNLVAGMGYVYTAIAFNSVGPSAISAASASVSITAAATPVGATSTAYFGPAATNSPLAADVLLLAPRQFAAGPQTLSFNCVGTYPCFAEVASNGGHATILDKNGFNVAGDIIKTSMVINAVSYNVYTHSNPQYDAAFILKFL